MECEAFSLPKSVSVCGLISSRSCVVGACSVRNISFGRHFIPSAAYASRISRDPRTCRYPIVLKNTCTGRKCSNSNHNRKLGFIICSTSSFHSKPGAIKYSEVLCPAARALRPSVDDKHEASSAAIHNLESIPLQNGVIRVPGGFSKTPTKVGEKKPEPDTNSCNVDIGLVSFHGSTSVYDKITTPGVPESIPIFSGVLCRPILEDIAEEKPRLKTSPGIDERETLYITTFLKGKHIFITGATGFLAKVLVERILRLQPDVAQLYLLIQHKSGCTVEERLDRQVIDSELFRVLRSQHGDNYRDFMHRKLTAVGGNISFPGLGISDHGIEAISNKIDVIVNSAANTTFHERYDVALNVNTLGPQRILEFAKRCVKAPLYLQVSTSFVNGKREGATLEKPFKVGDNIAQEMGSQDNSVNPFSLLQATKGSKTFPGLDPQFEVQLAEASLQQAEMKDPTKNSVYVKEQMVELGLKRAHMFGWTDTYTFTKAMGEMMINAHKNEIPVAVVRPSVVESTLREPFGGWMEGLRMLDPIMLAYGKGQMEGFLVDPDTILDVVPADIVVNVILAAMAKHSGYMQRSPYVYQVASSVSNPLKMSAIVEVAKKHFQLNPMVDRLGNDIPVRKITVFTREWQYYCYMWLKFKLPSLVTKLPWLKQDKQEERALMILDKTFEQLNYLAKIYNPYVFYKGRFDASNTQSLLQQVSYEERETYNFGEDVKTLDWFNYLNDIHIPGLRLYVLKGRGTKTKSPNWKV